ncbi:MAG: endolytic transglycosylase MltG [Patescibacteria group bacterium]
MKKFYFRQYLEDKNHHFILGIFFILILLTITLFLNLRFQAPTNFPNKIIFTIEKGETLGEIAKNLKKENLIKSTFWLKNSVIFLKKENNIPAGDYFFDKPIGAFNLAKRITRGDFGLQSIRITIQEGLNIFEIADLLQKNFTKFDREEFIQLAKDKEGYLFPDTYFFAPNTKTKDFIEIMERNFEEKIKVIKDELENFGKPLDKVLTMASIVEKEASTTEARRMIAGILWKRLEIKMPLQVDVTFKYINGKNTYQLSKKDLKIDSPYNTYLYSGLTPTPISNPGLNAILATIQPEENDYLYFLSDKNGNMFYAESFEEHVANKNEHLY